MTTVLTERKRGYDFLKKYWDDRYNFEVATIKNTNTAAATLGAIYPGMPLHLNGTQWETIAAAGASGTNGFFVDDRASEAIASGATSVGKYKILVRGPGLVDLDAVAKDLDNASITLATVRTAMRAFSPPLMELRDPAHTVEQST